MTTKDYYLSLNDKQASFAGNSSNNIQYNSLNLNHNNERLSEVIIESSKSFTNGSKKEDSYDFATNSQKNREDYFRDKFMKGLPSNFLEQVYPGQKENCQKELGYKEKNSSKSSTLSLHISAYEKSVEGISDPNNVEVKKDKEQKRLIKKWESTKQLLNDSTSVIKNSFEYPRQQKEIDAIDPEVMQFKASQKLLNPNQSTTNSDHSGCAAMADSEDQPVSDSTQASDTEQTSLSTSVSPNIKSPVKEAGDATAGGKATAAASTAPTSKLDALPRENLLALLKKQAMASKESKKQIEEYREKIKALEEQCKSLEEKAGNNSANEMMTFELDDYKNSCAELKKQLENQKEAQQQKDELVRDLTQRNDLLMQEKAETNEKLKEAKALATKLQKEIDEQHTILSENTKEAQSLTLQSQQIRAEYDLEIAKLNTQLKRFREESSEQQKYITEKTAETRRLKSDFEALQQSYDNLKIEHSTFKERAEYVLKQKTEEQTNKDASAGSASSTTTSTSGKMEIDELIRTLNSRNEKITQLTERSSYLEDELRSTQDYAKNIKNELEDAQHSLNQLRTRGLEERRRAESDYDFRLRQAYTEKEILQKQLNRTIEQSTEEKEKLIESFQRQNAELEEKNRELTQKMEEYRNLAAATTASSATTPRATTPIRVTTRRPKFPQPINFLHEPSAIITSTNSSATNMHPPGLDHENDEDDFRSLQEVINDADDQTTITGPRPISAFDDLISRPSIEFYTVDEYEALERQLAHTRDLLNDMEDTNAKLVEQIKILKEEIRRLERNTEREEHTKNGEYLKIVLMKYLAPPKVNDERQQLLPVLTTMLRLSPEEVAAITGYIKESLVVSTDESNGWTSYLWSNIV